MSNQTSFPEKFPFGTTIAMPEPVKGDCWQFGGFAATVTDYIEEENCLIVEDADGDFWEIEPERIEEIIEE